MYQQSVLAVTTQQLALASQKLQMLMNALTSSHAEQVTLTETRHSEAPAVHVTYMPQSGALILLGSNLHHPAPLSDADNSAVCPVPQTTRPD